MNLNPMELLSRLMGRSSSPIVSQLYTNVFGQPLLVHAPSGKSLIQAYMAGAVTPRPALTEFRAEGPDGGGTSTEATVTKKIGIINISGPLVSRPMPGICGDGPLSYEAIGEAFDAMLADPEVIAIVGRFDTPGGMVSGCFDLVDRIYSARGQKPLIAVVDDHAYSAGCALASAFDETWVSRTGGTGSAGVVGYHEDRSGANAKAGIVVTAIYAGAKKVDMSGDFPLSDTAKSDYQAKVDGLYTMFVDTLARNLNMSPAAIRATEAAWYAGQAGIDNGFAHKLGTFKDAMAEITGRLQMSHESGPEEFGIGSRVKVKKNREHDDMTKDAVGEIAEISTAALGVKFEGMDGVHRWYVQDELEPAEAEPSAAKSGQPPEHDKEHATSSVAKILAAIPNPVEADAPVADAAPALEVNIEGLMKDQVAALATAITAAKLPEPIAAALVKRGPIAEQTADQAVAHAQLVRSTCAAVNLELLAPEFIGANTPIDQVRTKISALRMAGDEEVNTTHPQKTKSAAGSLNPVAIYEARRRASQGA